MCPFVERSRAAAPQTTLTMGAVGVGGIDAAAVTAAAAASPVRSLPPRSLPRPPRDLCVRGIDAAAVTAAASAGSAADATCPEGWGQRGEPVPGSLPPKPLDQLTS